MEAFFAVGAASVAVRLLAGRSALVSFAYIGTNFVPVSTLARLLDACPRVVLDSGAFTAWTKGKPVDLGRYLAFIEEHGHRYAWIAALDAIGDWRGSIENWTAMLDRLPAALAAKVVPVFHEGEPVEVLDTYCERAPLVGLGRTEGRNSKQKTFAFYDACFNAHPEGRFHAFGNGSPDTLECYPFASFDCTTWERDATYTQTHGWPLNRVSKEMMMRVYLDAFSSIHFTRGRQLDMVDMMNATANAPIRLAGT